uniref:Uncharacterized protein n=1 Tax=Amphiprion ocellaris TaxID=80972 RepID=A0A3Q1ARK6_AMPOC
MPNYSQTRAKECILFEHVTSITAMNRFTQRQWMIVDCCCFALCCLPVFTCKVTSAVGACPCLPLLDCIGCVPPASLAMRASVRQRYGIQVLNFKTFI